MKPTDWGRDSMHGPCPYFPQSSGPCNVSLWYSFDSNWVTVVWHSSRLTTNLRLEIDWPSISLHMAAHRKDPRPLCRSPLLRTGYFDSWLYRLDHQSTKLSTLSDGFLTKLNDQVRERGAHCPTSTTNSRKWFFFPQYFPRGILDPWERFWVTRRCLRRSFFRRWFISSHAVSSQWLC